MKSTHRIEAVTNKAGVISYCVLRRDGAVVAWCRTLAKAELVVRSL